MKRWTALQSAVCLLLSFIVISTPYNSISLDDTGAPPQISPDPVMPQEVAPRDRVFFFRLDAGERTLSTLNNGGVTVSFSVCGSSAIPGLPMVPVKRGNILLPPDADPRSVRISIASESTHQLSGNFRFECAPLPKVDSETDASSSPRMDVRGTPASKGLWPPSALVNDGVHNLRSAVLLSYSFYPCQFDAATGSVVEHSDVVASIEWNGGRATKADALTGKFLFDIRETIDNYDDASPQYSKDGNNSTYAVITTNGIASKSTMLGPFMDFINISGYDAILVTENQYGVQTGKQRALNIRAWLQSNYVASQIESVLLVGNPDPYDEKSPTGSVGDLPMIMCWPRIHATDYTSYDRTPTDAFYADLTGDWDLDGDNFYGEYPDDGASGGVDFLAEVNVGRIPVYSSDLSDLDSILERNIFFPSMPGDWRGRALLPMAISNYYNEDGNGLARTDGQDVILHTYNDILAPHGIDVTGMYEASGLDPVPSGAFHFDYPITTQSFIDEFNKGCGAVFWWGHGDETSAARKYWYRDANNNSIPESGEMEWESFFGVGYLSALTDETPAFFYQSSCANGYPEISSNLGYSLLRHGSAIATVCAAMVSWYNEGAWEPLTNISDNTGIGYSYFYKLINNNMSAGAALATTRALLADGWGMESWMNKFTFNLYGDPQIRYWHTPSMVPVHLGWNLISIPFAPLDPTLPLALMDWDADVSWDRALWYDPGEPGNLWRQFNTLWDGSLNDLPHVNHTMGIWVNFTSVGDGFLNVCGVEPASTLIPLRAGWNMVGYPAREDSSYTAGQLRTATGATVIEGFDEFAAYGTSALGDDYVLRRGQGYWVFVPAETSWTVDW